MGVLHKARQRAMELKETKGNELAEASMAKVREVLAAFNAGLPLLKEAGCRPTGVEVELGLPPKIVANFATSDVSEEAVARITADNPDKTLACSILKALVQGARLQRSLEVGRLRASSLAVEISLPPCLKLGFST